MTPLTDVKTPSPLFSLNPRENLRASNFSPSNQISSFLHFIWCFNIYQLPNKKMGKKKLVWSWVLMLMLKSNSYSPKQNHRKPILYPNPTTTSLPNSTQQAQSGDLVSRFGFERKSKALRLCLVDVKYFPKNKYFSEMLFSGKENIFKCLAVLWKYFRKIFSCVW